MRAHYILTRWTPFNRTSMESKLPEIADNNFETFLLIEPVWNRNMVYMTMKALSTHF